jgi:hypothetical protein
MAHDHRVTKEEWRGGRIKKAQELALYGRDGAKIRIAGHDIYAPFSKEELARWKTE